MLEMMIGGGGGGLNYHPYSGPGNKRMLAGNEVSGWFGVVETNQLPTLPQIAAQFNLTYAPYTGSGTIAPYWLKARLKNKYVFVPNAAWSTQLSFQSLYNAGLIYGVDGTPPVPSGLTAVNQLSYFEWKDPTGKTWLFKVRVLESSTVHQATATTDVTNQSVLDSENAILYSHISAGGTPADFVQWDNLNGTDNPYKVQSFWFWSTTYIQGGKVMAAYNATTTSIATGWYGPTETFTWMPVLEVMDPNDGILFALGVKLTTPNGTPTAVSFTQTDTLSLTAAANISMKSMSSIPVATDFVRTDGLVRSNSIRFSGQPATAVAPAIS